MPQILIVESLEDHSLATFAEKRKGEGYEITYEPSISPAEIGSRLVSGNFDALIVRNKVIDRAAIAAWAESNPNKLCIVRAGSNTSTIDVTAATEHGVAVMNTPGANAQAVAEYIIGQITTLANEGRSREAAQDVRNRTTKDKKTYAAPTLNGKTLALIGTGAIGSKVARVASAWGMIVKGYSPHFTPEKAARMGVMSTSTLEEALADANFVTIQANYPGNAPVLINETALGLVHNGAKLVNVSLGNIIEPHVLLRAIDSGKVAGLALDLPAAAIEKLRIDAPALFENQNVAVTPLIACEAPEADAEITNRSLSSIVSYLSNRTQQSSVHVVNPDFINSPRIRSLHSEEKIHTHNSEEAMQRLVKKSVTRSRSFSDILTSRKSASRSPSPEELTTHTSKIFHSRAGEIDTSSLFLEDNLIIETLACSGIGKIFITYENEATPEKYAYSGVRVLSPMSDEKAIENAKRLSLTSSSWKNWLINHAIQEGALSRLPERAKDALPASVWESREVYGGRVIIIPEDRFHEDTGIKIEAILKDSTHPYFAMVSSPLYETIGRRLNELEGRLKVTPDFGPNASTADIMHHYTEHVLGISAEQNGSGGKSEYSITSIKTALQKLGIEDAPKDAPITVMGAAGALGSGVCKYLREKGFTNVAVCDLVYNTTHPTRLPKGWKVAAAIEGKFTDECLERSGTGSWIITTAYGDEMHQSNWQKMKPGTKWIGAQNKDLPEGRAGILFSRDLKALGILHLPGQVMTIGGTMASWVECCARKTEDMFFDNGAAHEVVSFVTKRLVGHMIDQITTNPSITTYEAMLDYANKKHWQPQLQTHAARLEQQHADKSMVYGFKAGVF